MVLNNPTFVENVTLKQQLQTKRQTIIEIAHRYGAHNVRIFGSVAREEESADSDVDFLVDMDSDRSLIEFIGLMQELESLLSRKVDIAEFETLHPRIREQVIRESIPL